MFKKKYYSLSKEEKIKVKNDFYETDFGKSMKARLNRLLIIGILGLIFSTYLFIWPGNKWDVVTACILVLASILFIVESFLIRIDKINTYLINKKK